MKAVVMQLMLVAGSVWAQPPIMDNVTHEVPGARAKYGLTNFKMVMPGVLYRGGTTVGREGNPMTAASLEALCNDGFGSATYVYSQNWAGDSKTISCNNGQLTYRMNRWNNENEVNDLLRELKIIIDDGKGAMYVHCWYGVHASGFVVTAALKQFCGLSDEQALAYWNSNAPKRIQYPKVQEMVRRFRSDPALNITAEQKARVCPNL